MYPGNCWAFKGSQGYLVIRLSLRILPTSFCVEHIPKALSPTGNITSAPRNFTVFVRNIGTNVKPYNWTLVKNDEHLTDVWGFFVQGLDDEYQEEGKLLGQYIYQEDGESLQTFPVMVSEESLLTCYK